MEEIIHLDKQLLLMVNGSDSLFMDHLILFLTNAKTWIPMYVGLLYVVIKSNKTYRDVLLIMAAAGLCVFLAGGLDDWFVKPTVARWRPTHDPEIGSLVDVANGYRGGNYGFFSAHAANTFSIAVFFSLLIRQVAAQLLYAPLPGCALSWRYHHRTAVGRFCRMVCALALLPHHHTCPIRTEILLRAHHHLVLLPCHRRIRGVIFVIISIIKYKLNDETIVCPCGTLPVCRHDLCGRRSAFAPKRPVAFYGVAQRLVALYRRCAGRGLLRLSHEAHTMGIFPECQAAETRRPH